jgi:myosin heavy subunit
MTSAQFGKFESLEELLKAYQNLESAYTKKCQLAARLKKQLQELQDKYDQIAPKASQGQTPENTDGLEDNSSIIEPSDLGLDISDNVCQDQAKELEQDQAQGQDQAQEQDQEQDQTQDQDQYDLDAQIEGFFEAYPQAKQYALLIGQAITAPKPVLADFLEAFVKVLLSKSPQDYLKDKEFLENFVYTDQDIRQYFIKSYLNGLFKGERPKTICGKAAAISVTPPPRPKSLAEARDLAKKILTK